MGRRSTTPKDPADEKVVMFVEVAPWIKKAMEGLATDHSRSLTGEATVAFKQYIEAHKKEKGGEQ
jgi:hypothetical protein